LPALYNLIAYCRAVEDIGVVYLGSAVFKISRLTFIALFSVHLFACIFYRVKIVAADSVDDVAQFYISRNIQEDVRSCLMKPEAKL
jgi:hypothetical protein